MGTGPPRSGARRPLQPEHALLELLDAALVEAGVDLLLEVVDELQGDVVEVALRVGKRGDVPTQQRPQKRLRGRRERPAEAGPAHRRTVGRDRPQSLRALAVAQGGHRCSGGAASRSSRATRSSRSSISRSAAALNERWS